MWLIVVTFSTRARLLVCILILLIVVECQIAFGQQASGNSQTANVTVTIVDLSGVVVPYAEVSFKGAKEVTTKTAQNGSVDLQVPYGEYLVTANYPGFKSVATKFRVDGQGASSLKIELPLAPTGDPVFVDGIQTVISDLPNVIEPDVPSRMPIADSRFTFYAPSVYMQLFHACFADQACTRKDSFRLKSIPNGCCILVITNGDGRGTDTVSSYRVFLNGKRLLPTKTGEAQIAVKLRQQNSIKVILVGEPSSKIFVSFDYDPGQSN